MDTDRAGKILERHGLTKKAFADMMGVKPSTARMAFSLKRFSKKMVAKLEELRVSWMRSGGEGREGRRLSVIEGMVQADYGYSLESLARKIYAVPKNRFLRLIEFKDGTHGKFRCKPGYLSI